MTDDQYLLKKLQEMLHWKRSKAYYAGKLGISLEQIKDIFQNLKSSKDAIDDAETAHYISELEDAIVKYEEDLKEGKGTVVFNSKEEIRTLDELIEKCRIDTSKWEVVKYVQNYWGNAKTPHWQVKAWLGKRKEEHLYQDAFVEFLKIYQSNYKTVIPPDNSSNKDEVCLVINKQDAHYNKFDVGGDNSLEKRFEKILRKTITIVNQALVSNSIERLFYVVGSDEMNSEFTNTTTKGTPQTNINTYHESFSRVCNHETTMIDMFLEKAEDVDVIYVPGNHDEYVGWHIITWLQAYYRDEPRVTFDVSPSYRKYVSYGKTAMMFNHGDVMKGQNLALVFPMEMKESWSNFDNYYIFTGDKHHEVTQSLNGIKFFQIPAFSNAKSSWDERKGYTCVKGEVTAFLIDKIDGITNIFKQYL
jgi:sulfur relay (sulfurtransferase) DsrC/TusE family protein